MGLNTVIESLGVYTPEGRLSTKELVDGCKVKPVLDLEELTGIKTRPVVADNEYGPDLAREAATRCFEISKYQPEDIDLVICANISRYNGPNWKASQICYCHNKKILINSQRKGECHGIKHGN